MHGALGTKSALGNKRQLTNQIAGKDALLFSPFFGIAVVLFKSTDKCENPHGNSPFQFSLQTITLIKIHCYSLQESFIGVYIQGVWEQRFEQFL